MFIGKIQSVIYIYTLNKESGSGFISIDLFKIHGEIGANAKGVTIGSFEISYTNYLVTINSIDHSKVANIKVKLLN